MISSIPSIAAKADKTYVDSKMNTIDLQLLRKADSTEVGGIKQDISNIFLMLNSLDREISDIETRISHLEMK